MSPRCPLGGVVALIAALYLAKEFLIPIVLAALVAFSLSPVVKWLERKHIPRMLAVLSVCFAVTLLLVSIAWTVVSQMTDFAAQLPHYRTNLLSKVEQLKSQSKGPWWGAAVTISEVADSLQETAHKIAPNTTGGNQTQEVNQPVEVKVVPPSDSTMKEMGLGLASVAGPFGTGAVVAVVAIFMLMARDNLRDRMVHLAGRGRLRVTHQAMADAGRRVSRYLLAQTVVNVLYGGMVWLATALIGVPNAPLWGLVGAVLRFVPYIGPVVAFALPLAVSLAVAPTWAMPLWVAGSFIVIEIVVNNMLEPYFYSSSTGLSPLAIIVSALFWGWLWGPMGLVLATPLTVCASVIGRQVPALSFLHVLLSDDPPITPADRFYQRLLSENPEEALKVIEAASDDATLPEALDEFALPAVTNMQAAISDGDLNLDIEDKLLRSMRRILPDIERVFEHNMPSINGDTAEGAKHAGRVLIIPVANEVDSLVGELMQSALRDKMVHAELIQHSLLRSEKSDTILTGEAGIVVLVAATEDSARAARALARSVPPERTDIKVHVLLAIADTEKHPQWREHLQRAGATDVATTLIGAVKNVLVWLAMLPHAPASTTVTAAAVAAPHGDADAAQVALATVLQVKAGA